jgi:signal transduction histidine kinase
MAPPNDAKFAAFLADVDTAYVAHDDDRALLERSIELASAELLDQNDRLARDLESIQRLELELRQADKLRAVGQLAAGIAHEINTPIQFVGDSISFVREAVRDLIDLTQAGLALAHSLKARGIDAPELARVITAAENTRFDELHAELGRVSQIVQAMKQFGRPDQREKVLADVNRCVLDTLTVSASEVKHVADVTIALGELPAVLCYPGELHQVFLNLLVNAAHAISERFGAGGRGEIHVTTACTDGAIIIRVRDNGMGIDLANRPRIFEPFFTTKEVGRGSGQGLAISRSIVSDKHGGTLSFESTVGQGTTFVVSLPITTGAAAEGSA